MGRKYSYRRGGGGGGGGGGGNGESESSVTEVAKAFKPLVYHSSFVTAAQLLQTMSERVLRLGVRVLDSALGGGLFPGRLYLFYGEPGTGKTTISLVAAIAASQQGDVLWITGDVFPLARLERMARLRGAEQALERIQVAQSFALSTLPELLKAVRERVEGGAPLRLIVVDDIGIMLRAEGGREQLAARQQLLAKVLTELKTISARSGSPVIITTEVMARPEQGNKTVEPSPVGGYVLLHAAERIRLSHGKAENERCMHLEEVTWSPPSTACFRIVEHGIED